MPVSLDQSTLVVAPGGGHTGCWAKMPATRAAASAEKVGDFPCWLTRLVLSNLLGPPIFGLRSCSRKRSLSDILSSWSVACTSLPTTADVRCRGPTFPFQRAFTTGCQFRHSILPLPCGQSSLICPNPSFPRLRHHSRSGLRIELIEVGSEPASDQPPGRRPLAPAQAAAAARRFSRPRARTRTPPLQV